MTRWQRGAAVGLAAACLISALLASWLHSRDDFRLPSRLSIADPVADLSAGFERTAVLEEAAGDPVRPGVIQPGEPLRGDGPRVSLVAPPRSRIHFALDVPRGAVLRFAVGVEGAKARRTGLSGVVFAVSVDGRRSYRRVVNPAAHRDQRWFDEAIPLTAATGGHVD